MQPDGNAAVLSISDELFVNERGQGDIVYLKETNRGEFDGAWPPESGLLSPHARRARVFVPMKKTAGKAGAPDTAIDLCNAGYLHLRNVDQHFFLYNTVTAHRDRHGQMEETLHIYTLAHACRDAALASGGMAGRLQPTDQKLIILR
jgi:hypothetical protein